MNQDSLIGEESARPREAIFSASAQPERHRNLFGRLNEMIKKRDRADYLQTDAGPFRKTLVAPPTKTPFSFQN